MRSIQKLTAAAMLSAIAVISSHVLFIPFGPAKAFPVQHLVNVIAAVWLGPLPAVGSALLTSVLRNLLGIGTVLAFPGSLFGALLAGLLYRRWKKPAAAAAGEWIGTSGIGALAAVPVAEFFLGVKSGAFYFVLPFFLSSLCGGLIGLLLLKFLPHAKVMHQDKNKAG
ncbi:energy coupling factor transporter S component ThiW [Fictibacillus iocasae]|uniref:Energy coupling factor transporter S component ThiW n=1 Tax=Fictibacillus iocasae TaxID=2715437 RepID=A0ABW2NW16_9BACL